MPLEGLGGGRSRRAKSAGLVRLPVEHGAVDPRIPFPGFTRAVSLADEILLEMVREHGADLGHWFTVEGVDYLQAKARAISIGGNVRDLTSSRSKRQAALAGIPGEPVLAGRRR